MIQVFDEATLRLAYRLKLGILSNLSRERLEEASYDYENSVRNINLNVVNRGRAANSLAYKNAWAGIKEICYIITEGLKSSEAEFANIFDGYQNSVKNFADLKENLIKENFLNRKKLKSEFGFFNRFHSFQQQSINNIDTLKHPRIIDYYFNKENLCSTENGLISLPERDKRKVKIKNVSVATQYSTLGKSEQSAETIKTNFTSHQYICRSDTPIGTGAKLTYCLLFSKKSALDKVVLNDASVNFALISNLFYLNDNNEIVDIDYSIINKGRSKILYINEPGLVEIDKLFITLTQNKYVDIGKQEEPLENQIVNATLNSFEIPTFYKEAKYVYEFNIDLIEVYKSNYQKIGLFRLNETINTKNYTRLSVNWDGFYLDRFKSFEVFIKGTFSTGNLLGTEVLSIDENTNIDVSKYEEVELLFILESNNAYSGYIKTIDVKAA